MSYARSDVMYVTVSRAHGGCGEAHSRPVVQGAPVKTWQLDCPQCAAYLLNDPLWSGSLAEVPSTPDEDTARETARTQTERSREDIMALALAKIAGLPVAEFLGGMIGNTAIAVESGQPATVKCPAGHENFATAKFCAECGGRLGDEQPTSAVTTATETSGMDAAPKDGIVLPPARKTMDTKPARQPRRTRAEVMAAAAAAQTEASQ